MSLRLPLAPEEHVGGAYSSGGVSRMHNFNTDIAGKSSPVEGNNAGEPMHLHGGHQPGVVRRLPGNLIPNDQALPNRISRRRIGQQSKHALQAPEVRTSPSESTDRK